MKETGGLRGGEQPEVSQNTRKEISRNLPAKVFILEGLDSWLYQTSSFNFLTQRMNVVFPLFAPVKQFSHLLDLV